MIRILAILLLFCLTCSAADNNPRVMKLRGFKGLWLSPTPPWSPTNMPNLFGWWKADTLTNLVNGSEVAFWTDSSGHNLHMRPVVTETGTSPYWTNNFQNSKPAVFFDGSNDYLTNAAAMEQTNCFFFVIRHMIPSTSDSYLFETASANDIGGFGAAQYFRWAGGNYTNAEAYAGATMTITNSLTNTVTTYVLQFAGNATGSRAWTNGVPALDPQGSGQLIINGMKVGTSMAVNNFYKGHLLEMGGITNAFVTSGTTLQDLTAYLRAKYAHH